MTMSNYRIAKINKIISLAVLGLIIYSPLSLAQTEPLAMPDDSEDQFKEITISSFASNIYNHIISGIKFTFSTFKQATSDIISIKPEPTPEPGIVSAIKKASSNQNSNGSTSNVSNPNNANQNNTVVIPRRSSGSSSGGSSSGGSGNSSGSSSSSSGSSSGSTSTNTKKTVINPTPSSTVTISPQQTPNSTPRSTPQQTPSNTGSASATPATVANPTPSNTVTATPASTPTATPSPTASPNSSPTNSPQSRLNVHTASIFETFATILDYVETLSRQNNSILQKK